MIEELEKLGIKISNKFKPNKEEQEVIQKLIIMATSKQEAIVVQDVRLVKNPAAPKQDMV
jgi:hypothetical protein